ncbi:hypothetical protein [Rhizobium sp. YTU87027]|uniref:hypothetical protein n=1 Tax=Rhizobium TaxID=379 RepID=UPI003D69C2D7
MQKDFPAAVAEIAGGLAKGKMIELVRVYGSPPLCKKKRQSRQILLQRIRLIWAKLPKPQWEPLECQPTCAGTSLEGDETLLAILFEERDQP